MKILKFYSDCCGPCVELESVLVSVSKILDIPIEYIDNSMMTDFSKQLEVYSNPTLIIMDEFDQECARHIGLISEENLIALIETIKNKV